MPSFLISDKNWAIDTISKKTSGPPHLQIYSSFPPFSGGSDFFFEIASIAQFLSEIEKEGIKLFRRAISFYPDTKNMSDQNIVFIQPQIVQENGSHETVDAAGARWL